MFSQISWFRGLCNSGHVEEVEKYLIDMLEGGNFTDVYTYYGSINSLCKKKKTHELGLS